MQGTYPARNPAPQPVAPRPNARALRGQPRSAITWLLIAGAIGFFLISVTIVALAFGAAVVYSSGRILPGVSVMGTRLGSLTPDDAAAQLQSDWAQITLRDGARTWSISPSQLGLTLDARATALEAQRHGRGDGSLLAALFGDSVAPVVTVNAAAAQKGIQDLSNSVNVPAVNATVRISDGGRAVAVPAAQGRSLSVAATVHLLVSAPADALSDGAFDLVMTTTSPTVLDASALLDKAKALLASPLTIDAFDPIQGQTTTWTVPAQQWGQWLTTSTNTAGVSFSLDNSALTNYLNGQNLAFGDGRHLDVARSVTTIQTAISAGTPHTTLQVYHNPTRYTVLAGDTIGSIAWAHGIPMWRIARANSGVNTDSLSVGQVINIPSKDDMLPLPAVPNKRIVVSISQQHMWVYENGQTKWDWVASTGIADSPTAPGVFQVQSHEMSAYAGNWNLWMPTFMGIYEAVPGFMNGIHGFPTRNGQGVIWQGALGHPVTFGCILLSSANAQSLYNWAEDGVVVEIKL